MIRWGGADYVRHYNIAQRYDGLTPAYSEYDRYNYETGSGGQDYADIAWRDKYYKKTWWLQRYNINIRGGAKKATYFVNLGYLHQPGMFKTEKDLGYNTNNNADRFNFRSNISVDVTSSTHLNVDLYGWVKKNNTPGTDAASVFNLLSVTPANVFNPYYDFVEGSYDQDNNAIIPVGGKLVAGSSYNKNPWAELNRKGYSRVMQMYGSVSANLRQDLYFITKGLYAQVKFALDSQTNSTIQRTRNYAYYTPVPNENEDGRTLYHKTGNDGSLSNTVENKSGRRYLTINVQLGYDRSFGKNNVSAAVHYDQFENATSTGVPTRYQGICGYASYNYDHRYGIDVTGAYHGWYGFAPGHKFGFFPTVSAGWTISNEKFLKDSDAVNFLKLRASYGMLGSTRGVDQFAYMGFLSQENNVWVTGKALANNNAGYYEGQIANPDLTWEQVRQTNVGLDATLFGNRFSLTADWFYDRRSDIYGENNRVSTLLGLNSNTMIKSNIGAMRSSGFEIGASLKDTFGKFSYRIGGTFTYAKNIVDENGASEEAYDYLNAIGYPIGRKLGYVAEGIFQSYEEIAAHATQNWSEVKPGDIAYKDVNQDGIIDNNDRVPIGYNTIPEIFYGINLGLRYGPVSLNILFQGAAHVSHSLNDIDYVPFSGYSTIFAHETDYWSPENAGNSRPRTTLGLSSANNTVSSTYNVHDADYIRLKRVELAYKFKQGSSIFLSGYNLFTWSKFGYGDPESATGLANLPLTRNFSFGARVIF